MISRKKLENVTKKLLRVIDSGDNRTYDKIWSDLADRYQPDDLFRVEHALLAHSLNGLHVGDPIKANQPITHTNRITLNAVQELYNKREH